MCQVCRFDPPGSCSDDRVSIAGTRTRACLRCAQMTIWIVLTSRKKASQALNARSVSGEAKTCEANIDQCSTSRRQRPIARCLTIVRQIEKKAERGD
jgi:hypothetical protein